MIKEPLNNCLRGMKRKAHGAQEPRHIKRIVEVASTAQRSDSLAQAINQRVLWSVFALALVFLPAITASAADINSSFDFDENIPIEIGNDVFAAVEYCDGENCAAEYCDGEYCEAAYCDSEYCTAAYCDGEYCEDEYCEGEYCEEDEDDLDSLFEDLENDNLMFIDTSFAWDNKTINSGRFDYRTLEPDDIISIPLVDSSQDKFYTHPIVNQVTSRFGRRGNQWHYGTDVRLRTGDPVKSALDGIVRVIQFDRYGYGNVVVVRHHNGIETLYGHLSKVLVKTNQPIKAGETLGLGGNTGRSTGAHLHFEIRYYGEPFNPEYIIDFDNYVLKSGTLVLTRDNFEYLTELRKTVYYTVRSGDNLSSIAKRHGTTVNNLCRLNGITPKTILRVGRRLVVRSGTEVEQQVVSSSQVQSSASSQNAKPSAVVSAPAVAAAPAVSSSLYYTVRSGDNLSNIAKRHGTTVNSLCRLNGITPDTVLRVGRRLLLRNETEAERQIVSGSPAQASTPQKPQNAKTAAVSAAPAVSTDAYYTVRSGDNLSTIAKRHGTTVSALCQLNGITTETVLRVGRRLLLRNETEAKQQIVSGSPAQASTLQNAKTAAVAAAPAVSADVYYTVRNGDNLSTIAKRHGTTVSSLCRLNGITPDTILSVGRRLIVKGK